MTLRVPFPEIKDVLIQKLPYKIMWMDEIGRIVYGNEQFCKRLGYKASEITKLSVFDINPSTTDESWIKHWNEVKEKSTVNFKSVHQTKEGKFYDVEVFAQFFSNNGKEIICAIVNDISASSFYRNLLDSSEKMNRIGGWKLNLQDGSIIVTKQALKLFETDNTQSFLPGQVINRFEESETLKALLSNVIRDGVSFDVTLKVKMDDAQPKYLRCVTSAEVKNKKVYKLIGSYQDVTDNIIRSKELENALQELSKLKAELETDNQYLREEINSKINFDNIICQSEAYRKVLEMVTQVAITDATVLITGESGTGKELLANAVHLNSSRKDRTLIKVNCATLPKELIESELFGHKKGAFTGAVSDKIGKFSLADGGTIFLDEIGELPLDLQSKLLRVLQEGEFDQLGAMETTKVDIRVIAATNRDLQNMVRKGLFRQDLYYRLNVFPIENIPLRTRKEDIPLLAQFFLEKYSAKAGKEFKRLSKKTISKLMEYNFPGNIRELENLIERAVIIENGTTLQPGNWIPIESRNLVSDDFKSLDDAQRDYIIKVLNHTNWRVSGPNGAATILKMKDKTLFARMKKLGIEKQVGLKK
ncbi:sigma 54-interacting transcriptional regulator [Aquimarina sp. LLG6339-5]|uniref:sigma 54-interacting transcriptional regulator n=1 Tax=Aquimarina sp. LLG6339-5 TaxID=3160830 RepID=UPI00386527C7